VWLQSLWIDKARIHSGDFHGDFMGIIILRYIIHVDEWGIPLP
jgi:hypothetical protein